MYSSHSACASLTRFVCVVLSYVLLIGLIPPLTRSGVSAGAVSSTFKAPAPSIATAVGSLVNPSGQSAGAQRAGEVLVRFRPEVSEGEKNALAAARGARRVRQLRGASRLERLELNNGQTPQVLAQQLAEQPSVEWVEPNYLITRDDITPNDARFNEQWALRNNSSSGGAAGQPRVDIAASTAWERTTGSALTVIAVIDSGVDFKHPDLARNVWTNSAERANDRDDDRDGYTDDLQGWDWVADSNQIRDEQGHGTSVAGIIAAEGNNAVGTTGVMWRASLMSLRVLDATGTGDVANAVEAIDYAVAHGAQVINLSWGLEVESRALRDAIERAGRRGVVVVCSAGNNGRNIDSQPYYPASYELPNLVSVAASDNADNLTSWSNWGAIHIAVAAPGADLLTTKMGGDYQTVSGTSAAAPVVSGIAGLVKSLYAGLSASDTRSVILAGARRVPNLNGKVSTAGVAHAAGALAFANSSGSAPGGGNGGGGDNGNGNGGNGGAGNGQGHGPSQQPGAPGHGSGGQGSGGSFNVTPPQAIKAAPENFQDQNALRRRRPTDPQAPTFIHSNLLPDCGMDCGGNTPGGAGGNDAFFAAARTRPENRTGATAGVDPGSRNFNWSRPLVSLAGRAGLDLNIALHYNSLVWTREGSRGIMYNADHGFPGPGFRLGFPVVQSRYQGDGGLSYLLETASGGREELRRLGAADSVSNTYEAPDGSNTQLVEYYRLVSPLNGKCLDVSQVSQSNGARLHQWDCVNMQRNQHWQIVPTDSGFYKILARHSGKSVDVEGAYGHSGAYVHQWDYVGGANQQWSFVPLGNGTYQIVARHSGKVLTSDYSYNNGGPITQTDNYYSDHQTWRLEPVSGHMVVRTTDGTQLSFVYNPAVYEYRCTEIKDRNGNYITINYDANHPAGALGRPTSVVDTLGRVFAFNYDAQKYLRSITQWWRRESDTGATVIEQHAWATFDYDTITIQTNFRDQNNNALYVHGPGTTPIPVLTKLGLPDGTKYAFDYTVWGQVNQIRRLAPDDHLLARESYNLPTDTVTPQSDCPRMSERREWAQDWNNGAEAITNYAETKNHTWQMPDQTWHTGTMMQVTSPVYYVFEGTPRTNVAYRVVQRTYAHVTGWDNGLPILERTYQQRVSDGYETLQRTVWTTWTQDNTSVNYPTNPRPVEYNIIDPQGNRKRTTIQYTSYNLPEMVREWGGTNASQVLRRTYYQYNFDNVYVSRRLIGLPGITQVYEGENTLMSKVEYHYDWAHHFANWLVPSTMHDSTYYGAGLTAGRGLVVGVLRYNKDAPSDPGQAMWMNFDGYDLAGSTVWTQDGSGHRTSIDYVDSFWTDSSNTRNTRAYPTRFTDPDNHVSTAEWNYDLGTMTRGQGPPPAGQTQGAVQTMRYDSAGRIERVTNQVNNAYTRYEYDPNYGHTRTYSTTKDLNSIAYTNTIRDGAGQVRLFVASHPGNVGGYRAQRMSYDALGRVVERTNMTEITSSGTPTGDDAAGYQLTLQWYDWKGRPTLTTFPNGNTTEAEYGGCGCAGGEVTTTRDERGRRTKFYKDELGRLAKVEEMNWLDSQGVYATTTYTYNGRDQMTGINQQGQTRSFGYDAHGRLSTRTTPEQGTTTYSYYSDDTTQTITDARGATTTYTYNTRHLPTQIAYGTPAGVAPTATVTLAYDAAGNRTSMSDGLGSVSYGYDQLSRLTSETRTFTDVGSYTLSYEYNLAGALTRVTNPWGVQVAYTYDTEGRPSGVNGRNASGIPTYAGISDYVSGIQYRAFDGMKQVLGGNLRVQTLAYDTRLRLSEWKVAGVLGWNYQYDKFGENSHRVTYAQNLYDPTLNRSYDYDQVGRLWEEHSGNEADAHVASPQQPFPSNPTGPISHSYRYDQHGNMTYRVGWGGTFGSYTNQVRSFTNNRQDGLIYDAAGNLTNDGAQYTYDATGQQTNGTYPPGWGGYANYSLQQSYDGDGLRAKKTDNGVTTYVLRSSVLGSQVVAELQFWNNSWNWGRGFVYLGGQLLALQQNSSVTWVHQDPVVKSQRLTDASGTVTTGIELDAWGGETGRSWNSQQQARKFTTYERDGSGNDQATFRQYHNYWMRFDQPDPYGGSYNMADPQSFNRYNYVQNDPVNFVDPLGLNKEGPSGGTVTCVRILDDDGNVESITCRDWGIGPPIFNPFYVAADIGFGSGDSGRRPITDIDLNGGGRTPIPRNDGVSDTNAGFTACGIASAAEYGNQVNGKWVGWTKQGPKTYPMSWPGNQHVSRAAALSNASAFRALGRVSFGVGTTIGLYQGQQALQQGEYGKAGKSGLDVVMGGAGTFGGLPGAGAAVIYFGVDMTIGWDKVAEAEAKSFSTQRLVNGRGLCLSAGMVK